MFTAFNTPAVGFAAQTLKEDDGPPDNLMGEGDFAAQGFVYLNVTHKPDNNTKTNPAKANSQGNQPTIRGRW